MKARHSIITGLLAVSGIVPVQSAYGQESLTQRRMPTNELASPHAAVEAHVSASEIARSVEERNGRRSPWLAGGLSYFLPGVGSYYAGNSAHGTRHVLIAGGALGLCIAGATMWTTEVVEDCFSGDCDSSDSGGATLMAIGAGVYLMNNLWAIVTAVGDANSHNRALSNQVASARLIGDIHIEPIAHVPRQRDLRSGRALRPKPTLGLQLVRRF